MEAQQVVIIGGGVLGPKVACRLKRLRPDFEVTMVDQEQYISYGGCGIPYYISGDLSDQGVDEHQLPHAPDPGIF